MKKTILIALIACTVLGMLPAFAQIKMTKEQMMFYTSAWKGERFPDGRPKLPDDLLKRALDVTIEDIQDYVGGRGYRNQFESGWQALHIDQPFAGRAVTAQFMPTRADMVRAIQAEGKAEGRVGTGTNTWVINELVMGDTLVADGFGKIVGGTLIGSNLGSGIAARTHSGFIFDGGIRDQEENRAIPFLNGFYRGYDPGAWSEMQLTAINAPVRIGRAVVLPGDLVLAKKDGVIFIPSQFAGEAIRRAEFTALENAYNYERNTTGQNAGLLEGGWTPAKYAELVKWVDAHPEKLKMPRAEFLAMVAAASQPRQGGAGRGAAAGRGGAPPSP